MNGTMGMERMAQLMIDFAICSSYGFTIKIRPKICHAQITEVYFPEHRLQDPELVFSELEKSPAGQVWIVYLS